MFFFFNSAMSNKEYVEVLLDNIKNDKTIEMEIDEEVNKIKNIYSSFKELPDHRKVREIISSYNDSVVLVEYRLDTYNPMNNDIIDTISVALITFHLESNNKKWKVKSIGIEKYTKF